MSYQYQTYRLRRPAHLMVCLFSDCLSGECTVAKRLIGCRLGWWVGLV